MSQDLPARELKQFQNLVKYYDAKQYRLGLQCCKKILAKHPKNGETLSMKALIMNATGKREEAMELAKEGLKNNFKSATCWHVVGILESRDRNYEKALTAYKAAIKQEPKNYIVLRDLSCMQHILRRYDEYRDTRLGMIPVKPSMNSSWVGFAMASYFCKDNKLAMAVLTNFQKSFEKQDKQNFQSRYDISEIILFSIQMMYDEQQFADALAYLSENDSKIVDTVARMELYTKLYMKLGKWEDAEKAATWLIMRNPDHLAYYKAMEQIINPDGNEARLIMYDVISKQYPRALTPKRIPLDFLSAQDPEFETRLSDYLRTGILKGRPALFQDIKPLYLDGAKVQLIEKMMLQLFEDKSLNPSCYPWCCYFLTKHFTKLGCFKQALNFAQKGLEHTPTLVELYVVIAKVHKKMGKMAEAVAAIDDAQALDTADRYTNCIACKYLLANGEIKKAEEMLAKFVRESTNVVDYLRELQVLWFESVAAKVAYENKNYGEALRRCHLIKRIFTDMFDDQFDFVQYCLRRCTMISFSEFLSFQDILQGHKAYEEAAYIASKIYIKLHDNPDEARAAPKKSLSVSERPTSKQTEDEGWGPRKEPPIDAKKLLDTTDPLGELAKFVHSLEKHQIQAQDQQKVGDKATMSYSPYKRNTDSIMTYALAIQLYMKKKQTCLALRSLRRGLEVLKETNNNHRNMSKHQSAAAGLFIGQAIKCVDDFGKNEDDAVKQLFEDMKLPSSKELRNMIDTRSMIAMIESDNEYQLEEWARAAQGTDYSTILKAQAKLPHWVDYFDDLIREKYSCEV